MMVLVSCLVKSDLKWYEGIDAANIVHVQVHTIRDELRERGWSSASEPVVA